jgi:hypothetical protein
MIAMIAFVSFIEWMSMRGEYFTLWTTKRYWGLR